MERGIWPKLTTTISKLLTDPTKIHTSAEVFVLANLTEETENTHVGQRVEVFALDRLNEQAENPHFEPAHQIHTSHHEVWNLDNLHRQSDVGDLRPNPHLTL